jgi:hypothetical protein
VPTSADRSVVGRKVWVGFVGRDASMPSGRYLDHSTPGRTSPPPAVLGPRPDYVTATRPAYLETSLGGTRVALTARTTLLTAVSGARPRRRAIDPSAGAAPFRKRSQGPVTRSAMACQTIPHRGPGMSFLMT